MGLFSAGGGGIGNVGTGGGGGAGRVFSSVGGGLGKAGGGSRSYLNETWEKTPFGTRKGNDIRRAGEQSANEQYQGTKGITAGMDVADTNYLNQYDTNTAKYKQDRNGQIDTYLSQSNALRNQAQEQATSAQSNYTNSIQPKMKANMESAMSLKDSMDPNNAVHTSVRDMYNKQGQAVQKQGMQDFGVMSALGAQAAAGQFGGASPMTAGMQGQIYAQNQGQAGNAYARAQQRMHDLQQQGIDRGFDQSNLAYDRGQQATQDFIGAEGEYLNRGRDSRNELNAFDADRFGVAMGRANEDYGLGMGRSDIQKGNAYGKGERDLGSLNQYYGTQQSILNNAGEREAAGKAGQGQFLGKMIEVGANAYGKKGGGGGAAA
jgi:hypothetical protein